MGLQNALPANLYNMSKQEWMTPRQSGLAINAINHGEADMDGCFFTMHLILKVSTSAHIAYLIYYVRQKKYADQNIAQLSF